MCPNLFFHSQLTVLVVYGHAFHSKIGYALLMCTTICNPFFGVFRCYAKEIHRTSLISLLFGIIGGGGGVGVVVVVGI